MYNIFTKFKEQNRTKSSTTNVRRDNLKVKLNNPNYINNDVFLKTLQKQPENTNDKNRAIKSSQGYRSIYFDEKIKLFPEGQLLQINKNQKKKSDNYENLNLYTHPNNNKKINKDLNTIDYNIYNSNKKLQNNFTNEFIIANQDQNLLAIKGNKLEKFNKTLNNISHENNINNKTSIKNTLNASRRNLTRNEILMKIIYPEESLDKIITESKKVMDLKKEIRSKMSKILNSKESIPLCDDFINKVEGFNRKLMNSLQSDFKLIKEKEKCNHFQFSKNLQSEPEKEYFMNTKNIKETRLPLETLLKRNFTQEELDIIKYDLDFFNKNNKILNTIKFLKPKSLLKKINEEDIELELSTRRKIIQEKKLKNMRAYHILKFFIKNKIAEYREKKKGVLISETVKNTTTESSGQENKMMEMKNSLNKKINSMMNNKNFFNKFYKEKFVNFLLIDLDQKLNQNKRLTSNLADNLPDCKRVKFAVNTMPIADKNRPLSTNKGPNDNLISTAAFSSRVINSIY